MRYAQFFQMSTGYVPGTIPPVFDWARQQPIEACGDRGVIVIDQRIRPADAGRIAAAECAKRGYVGWRMYEGRTFTDSKPVSGYWAVAGKPDNSASSAYYGA